MAKTRVGIVVSNKMEKTAVVRVDRMVSHERYDKRYRVSNKFAAHDENNAAEIGDTVTIMETRPVSKSKSWKIVSVDKKGVGQNIQLKEVPGTEGK